MRSFVAVLARKLRPRRDAEEHPRGAAEERPRRGVQGRPRQPGRRLHLLLTVATVLAAGAGGAAWYADHRTGQRDTAIRQALASAPPAAKAIFSYDYRNFDASIANGRTFVTGTFADEYAQTTAALKSTAVSEQAVVLAEVSATGVVRADTERVELLVYLNQYRRNVNTTSEKVDQNRVVLELSRVGKEWKVSRATAI
jgi:Mce-associated membrane protein